ncbi:MAG: DUF2269 family protein [Actinomycetota bacterium]|nr:DUF2269 family protein [Actinomycetota bacterium]
MEDPSAIYRILLLLHIAASIVGFGGVIAHGAYNARAFRAKAGEAAVLLRTTATVTNIAHYSIYAVLVFGILLISASSGDVSFSEPWISAGFLLWFLLVGAAHGLVRPAVRGLTERAEALPADALLSDDAAATAAAKKLALGGAATQLLLAAALVVMIWRF